MRSFAFHPAKVLQILSPGKTHRKSARFRVKHFASIRTITLRHSLSPVSFARIADSVPCGSPALSSSHTGLPCFVFVTRMA
jgi:hypothetical protein